MKRSVYKSGALLAVALLLLASSASGQEVTKEFHKEYTPGPSTALNIENKYGDVVVNAWDKQSVVIHVKVLVEMPNRERAEEYLGYIDVNFSQSDEIISAETEIDSRFRFTGWGSGSRRFRIDYTVNMPYQMDLALVNRYGDIDIDELRGRVEIDLRYGNLTALKLTRGNEKPLNTLTMSYGKARVDEAGWLDMVIRYMSNVEIVKSQALLVDTRYSKLNIGEASSVVAESKYDNLRIGTINNIVINAGYADIGIGTLTKKLRIETGYGSVNVDNIPENFESVEVDSRYTGVRLGIASSASYKLDAKVSYGSLRFNESNFRHEKRIVQNNTNETTGIVGSESSPSASVSVNASYGSVRLN